MSDGWGIGTGTRLFGVLGHPVGHSLSPAMQNAALREMGVDGVYLAFDVPPGGLADAVAGLKALGAGGVNCTIPHKEAALGLADRLAEDARVIGAVNTLVFRDGETTGHNTDAPGFLADLARCGLDPRGRRAVVLGAGGSARAVVTALLRAGARVAVANRTVERARELAEDLGGRLGVRGVECVPLAEAPLREALDGAALLVNTTAVGMSPRLEEMPPVPPESLGPELLVYDLIYNPLETRLLRAARERGARTANGAGMLAHQGALALELWTGMPAPAALMERVVRDTLREREARALQASRPAPGP